MEETNRFKGLDLIDRVPEKLWLEIGMDIYKAIESNSEVIEILLRMG